MKIAIVDIGWKKINPINLTNEALGGSETWLVQIANEFAKQGHVVNVYCACDFSCDISKNLLYKRIEDFLTKTEHFDFVILNRFFEKNGLNYIDFIKKNYIANHVYIQMHDLSFVLENRLLGKEDNIDKFFLNDDFVTIVTLNTWHQRNLLAQYPTLTSRQICIPNGLDLSLFKENENKRDNRILWSSCAERGLDILLKDVYPLVKAQIEDFGVDIASYNNFYVSALDGKDVKYLGKLSKEELYKEQSKHKLWFYPGTFAETFCITMLENIMNGCQIVSPITYGMKPTIGYSAQIGMKNNFRGNTYNDAVNEAAQKIVEILKSNNSIPDIYQQIKQKIITEYNWTNSVNLYVNDYKLNSYGNVKTEKISSNKKILILSMNCNLPYFRTLLSVTKDTWVKPILQGKYKNCIWFSYTCCDEKHKTPQIDFGDHMIYVDSLDDYKHTYDKTQKAYRMLVEAGVEFDYVLRTNTSVFVNLKNTIKTINESAEDEILGMRCEFGKYLLIPGLFFGMSKRLFDIAMSKNNNYVGGIPQNDDLVISTALSEYFGGNIKLICPSIKNNTSVLRYKPFLPGDELIYKVDEMYKNCIVRDPRVINVVNVLQVRPIYHVPDYNDSTFNLRFSRGHEFEHFYELNDALD